MRAFALMAVCAACSGLLAQQFKSEAEVRALAVAKQEEMNRLWQAKDFRQAVRLLEEFDGDPSVRRTEDIHENNLYNLACGYSLLGETGKAIAVLRELARGGYQNFAHIQQDSDFEAIRQNPDYIAIVDRMKAATAFWDGPVWKTPYQANLTEEEKIAGLSRFWSEAKFNFAWFELLPPEFDWDALYLSYLPKVRRTESTLEYYRVLQEFCAKLRDSHTNVYPPAALWDQANARPLLRTRYVERRVLISEVLDPELARNGVARGIEVIEVDGIPVREYAEQRIAPYQSASTPQDLATRTYEMALLSGAAGSSVELTLSAPDGALSKRSAMRKASKESRAVFAAPPAFEFRMLPGNIAYVALNTFGNDTPVKEFERQFDEIAKSNALVFDLRENGGGNSSYGDAILAHLIDKPLPVTEWRTRKYMPAYRAWGNGPRWTGDAAKLSPSASKRYSKPVVVLIGPRTFSAAEDFAADFDVMQRGKLIGEPSGGSTGQPLFFNLPGGGSARVCTKQNYYPDGRQFVGKGIQPHVVVPATVPDFRSGRDAVLEKALESLR